MERILRRLVAFPRWAEDTTRHLRSFARRTRLGVVGLIVISGIGPLAVAPVATLHEPSISPAAAATDEHRIRNIVLVHGAWADGSGWKGVYDIHVKDGYNVSIVREGLAEALGHKAGPVVVDAEVDPYALSLPSHSPFHTVKGFTLSIAKQVLSGRFDSVITTMERNIHLI